MADINEAECILHKIFYEFPSRRKKAFYAFLHHLSINVFPGTPRNRQV